MDPYRVALGYLGLIIVLCAVIVFNPLRWIWPNDDGAAPDLLAVAPGQVAPDAGVVPGSNMAALSAAVALGLEPGKAGSVPAAQRDVGQGAGLAAGVGAAVALAAAGGPDAAPDAVPEVAPEVASGDALEGMSLRALAGLRAATSGSALSQMITLQGLVIQALREGQSDAYIEALLSEAAGAGVVGGPVVLTTADGRVDLAAVLGEIVARSQGVELAEGDTSAQPDETLSPEAALVAAGSDVTYTVAVGDSLGSLALRFYGDSALFPLIFQANRGLMATPDSLEVGQVLIIPGRT